MRLSAIHLLAVAASIGALLTGCSDEEREARADAGPEPTVGAAIPLDVSLLFPLAADATTLADLPPVESEDHAFLRFEQFEVVAFDFSEARPGELGFVDLRLVSARIDPCPEGRAGPCQGLRLVFQPEQGTDAAIHAFYAVDRQGARSLAGALAELRDEHEPDLEAAPDWTVHPGLEPGSDYREQVVSLLAESATDDSLVRLAAFSFPGSFPDPDGDQRWMFRAADRIDGEWILDSVSEEGGATAQAFDTNAFIDPETRTTRTVATSSQLACAVSYSTDPASELLESGDLQAACGDQALAATALSGALELLDPARTPIDQTDCAACHLAPVVARTLAERFPAIVEDTTTPEALGPATAGIARAFGYHEVGDTLVPVVSPRVRRETQLSLDALAP